MSSVAVITGAEFDSMVERGAFDSLSPKKIELIHGEIRFMNPAGPIHDDYIQYLTDWSYDHRIENEFNIRVQAGFICDDNRPEPDVMWLRAGRYGRRRPTAADVMLLIEVSDSSLTTDLREKSDIYSESGVVEYWVVDIPNQRIHVMSDIEHGRYRSIEVYVPSRPLAPKCKPTAFLNMAGLFAVS